VIDVLAIRKKTALPNDDLLKRGDLFEIVLLQMKGGSALDPVLMMCRGSWPWLILTTPRQ
jgi:hypothetical protein